MKNLFKSRLVLIGLLLLTAATVTASNPVKIASSSVPHVMQFTDATLMAVIASAEPSVNWYKVELVSPTAGTLWLRYSGISGDGANYVSINFELFNNSGYWELTDRPAMRGAIICAGTCDSNAQKCEANGSDCSCVNKQLDDGEPEPMGVGSSCTELGLSIASDIQYSVYTYLNNIQQ